MTPYPSRPPDARARTAAGGRPRASQAARRPSPLPGAPPVAAPRRAAALGLGLLMAILSAAPACQGSRPAASERAPQPTAPGNAGGAATTPRTFHHRAMGTSFTLVLDEPDAGRAARAAAAACARIDALEACLSDWRADSELSRLGALSDGGPTGAVPVSADLWRVLVRAQELCRRTDGAFDVTVGPLVRLWRRARRQHAVPDPAEIARARAAVGDRHLVLDPGSRTVRLAAPGMRLDLGGIAKGDALDQALAVLRQHGIERALVEGGGDVVAGAPPTGRSGWRVALAPFPAEDADGSREILLAHRALATSGDGPGSLELAGQAFSHLLDPRDGAPVPAGRGASVLAPDGASADALASAACVLGSQRTLALLAAWPGVEVRLVEPGAGAARVVRSPGFPP